MSVFLSSSGLRNTFNLEARWRACARRVGDTLVPRLRGPHRLSPVGGRGERRGSGTGRGGSERAGPGLAPGAPAPDSPPPLGPASQTRLELRLQLGGKGKMPAGLGAWVTETRWGFRFGGVGVPFPNSCAGRVGGGGLFSPGLLKAEGRAFPRDTASDGAPRGWSAQVVQEG